MLAQHQLAGSRSFAAFEPRRARGCRAARGVARAHAEAPEDESVVEDSARAFRRTLSQSGNYSRKLMKDEDAARLMEEQGIGAVSKGACVLPSGSPVPAAVGARSLIYCERCPAGIVPQAALSRI